MWRSSIFADGPKIRRKMKVTRVRLIAFQGYFEKEVQVARASKIMLRWDFRTLMCYQVEGFPLAGSAVSKIRQYPGGQLFQLPNK